MLTIAELMASIAILEERGELNQLDESAYPPEGAINWLYGLTAGFYFDNAHKPEIREAALGLAERYYDAVEGRANLLSRDGRGKQIKSAEDIRRLLTEGQYAEKYFQNMETMSFYIRHMPQDVLRTTDPVHEYLTCLLPSEKYRGGGGNLMYQTRLAEFDRKPAGVIGAFVDACQALNVFYAVSGIALFFYSYTSGAPAKAYPLYRRFPGLLYEDGVNFGLEITRRTDVIRDVNWLTAVNDELLERAGGIEKARALAGEEVVLHPYKGGVVLQAGERPHLGDINKGKIPEAYRAVDEFLREVRYEEWEYPYLNVPDDVDGMAFTEEWSRRFERE